MTTMSIPELRAELRRIEEDTRTMIQHQRDLIERIEAGERDLERRADTLRAAEAALHSAILAGEGEEAAREAVQRERRIGADTQERLTVLRTGLKQAQDPARRASLDQQAVAVRRRIWRALAEAEASKIPAGVVETMRRAHACFLLGTDGQLVNPHLSGYAGVVFAPHDLPPVQLRALQEQLAAEHRIETFRP